MQHRLLRRERRPHEADADSRDVQSAARRHLADEFRHRRVLAFGKVALRFSRRDERGDRTFSRSGEARDPLWSDFAERLHYIAGSFDDVEAFKELKRQLEENDEKLGTAGNCLYYLSTPPGVFAKIVQQLAAAGLGPKDRPQGWSRIIIEKPFGTDLESARALQAEVTKVFEEKHVYRIDHYLGKEPVQDIMALRFANVMFEPIWNRRYIDCVQITAAETVGVEGRGGYYENAGALRDMIQNHVINMMALVAMEPPISPERRSHPRRKIQGALGDASAHDRRRFRASPRAGNTVPGSSKESPLPGYREEPSVDPNSTTETYAAVKFFIDNWRWADVPFYLRSGKRLARKHSEIAIRFRGIPHRIFGEAGDQIENNTLVMKIQPEEGVSIRFNAKVPGPKMHIRGVTMDFNYGTGFGVVSAPAYERLIGDAMRGDATLFTRWDAVEQAWIEVTPIMQRWSETRSIDFPNYLAGSQGPQSADALARGGRTRMEAHLMATPVAARRVDSRYRRDSRTVAPGARGFGNRPTARRASRRMNFVVFIDDPAHRDWVLERASLVAEKHPSRLVVLDSTSAVSGVDVSTSTRERGGTTIVSERVDIAVETIDHASIVSLTQELTVPDIPTLLWWSGERLLRSRTFSGLAHSSATVLVDSSGMARGEETIRELGEFLTRFPNVALPISHSCVSRRGRI